MQSTVANRVITICFSVKAMVGLLLVAASVLAAPQESAQTKLQAEIQKQQLRLGSSDVEERRDALMQLGLLHHPAAARVAATALHDVSPAVRVAAIQSVLWLPGEESATVLVPLLKEKDEFVRQETAYALRKTRSRTAVLPLLELLQTEKSSGVRGAAVVALGELGDPAAVVPLAHLLAPELSSTRAKKLEKNEFVLRSVARALGQIGNSAGVPALVAALEKESSPIDVRREAAVALGRIGGMNAVPALQHAAVAADPHLSVAAFDSLRRLRARPAQ
jgi:HEAT repeat protein